MPHTATTAQRQQGSSDAGMLLILPALAARAGKNGSFILTQKFLDGVLEYTARWPGPIGVCVARTAEPDTNLDPVEVRPDDLPFELTWWSADDKNVRRQIAGAGLVLGTLVDQHLALADLCRDGGDEGNGRVPLVYISEYSVLTRRQIIRAETRNPILRVRRELWNRTLERRCRRAVRLAAGIQCNGTPTFNDYRSLNPKPLLYFDTRVRRSQLAADETLAARTKELAQKGPLRLAFSGRLITMKGADHLPLVAAELKRLGVPFTLDICGAGALEDHLRRRIDALGLRDHVRLRGVLDFQIELMPFVARNVDLFVCCHRQGDPSCTYLETMSCGTPIAGYDNEAFQGVVETSGVGWLAPLDDPKALARRIAELHRNRASLMAAAGQARAFAAQHTFEKTMQARIDHMLACARPQPSSRPSPGQAMPPDVAAAGVEMRA